MDDFINVPSPDDFHDTLDAFEEYNEEAEAMMPQATYTLEVYDSSLLSNIKKESQWDSAMWGASWYLENKSEKTNKFYHVYKDDMGNWQQKYGKVGTVGRSTTKYYANEETVEKNVVAEKLCS